jgi:hypothetical protein
MNLQSEWTGWHRLDTTDPVQGPVTGYFKHGIEAHLAVRLSASRASRHLPPGKLLILVSV